MVCACLQSPPPLPSVPITGSNAYGEAAHTLNSRIFFCVFPESNLPLYFSCGFLSWLVIDVVGLECNPRAWEREEREWGYRQAWGRVPGKAPSKRWPWAPAPPTLDLLTFWYVTMRQSMGLTTVNQLPGPTLHRGLPHDYGYGQRGGKGKQQKLARCPQSLPPTWQVARSDAAGVKGKN